MIEFNKKITKKLKPNWNMKLTNNNNNKIVIIKFKVEEK